MTKRKKRKTGKEILTKEKENTFTRACKWLIWTGIFLSLLVPLMIDIGIFYPFISYRSLWFMGIVQVLFALWLFLIYHNKAYRPKLNVVLIFLILFITSITLSTLFGADPSASFWSNHERMTGLLMHLHLFAYFLVLMSFLKNEEEWHKVLGLAVAVATLVCIWGIADNNSILFVLEIYNFLRIVPIRIIEISQQGSTLGHYSFMGTYLLISAFLSLYLFLKTKGKMRIAYGPAFLVLALGIIINPGGRAMRGAFLIGLLILALLYLAFVYKNKYVKLGARSLLYTGLAGSLYLGLSAFQEGSFVRNTIMSLSGMPGRLVNWGSAWQAIKERPILGWGPENFEIALYKFIDSRVMLDVDGFVGEPWHDRAHNIIIENLVATGMLGTLLYFGLLASCLLILWKGYLKEQNGDFWTPAVFTALLAAHFIQNLTVFDMLSSYMLIFVIMAFASSAALKQESGLENTDSKKHLAWLKSLALIIILGLIVFVSLHNFVRKPYLAGKYTVQAINGSLETSLTDDYARAIYRSPLGRNDIRKYLAESAILRLNQATGIEHKILLLGETAYMIEEVKKSTQESPLNLKHIYTLGQLYNAYAGAMSLEMIDHEDIYQNSRDYALKAEEAYLKAIDLSPGNVQLYWGLAQAKENQGRLFSDFAKYEEAFAFIEQALEIEPRFYISYEMGLIIANDLLRDRQLAMDIIEQALQVDPQWEADLRRHLTD